MKLKFSAAVGLAVVMATGTISYAQVSVGGVQPSKADRPAKARGVPGSGEVEAFAKQLTLTTEQKDKVQTVVTTYRTGTKTTMADSALTADQKKTKVDELRTKSESEIRAILTTEQSEKAQQDNLVQKLLKVGPAKASIKEIADALSLTNYQKQQIDKILQDQRTKQKEIAKNAELTKETRQEQTKALRQDTQQKIQDLLTDQQKAKYVEMTSPKAGKDQAKGNKVKGMRGKGHGKKNAVEEQPAQQ